MERKPPDTPTEKLCSWLLMTEVSVRHYAKPNAERTHLPMPGPDDYDDTHAKKTSKENFWKSVAQNPGVVTSAGPEQREEEEEGAIRRLLESRMVQQPASGRPDIREI